MENAQVIPLLDVDQASEMLRISRPKLYRLTSEGEIRGVRIGSRLRFRIRDLEEFVEQNLTLV